MLKVCLPLDAIERNSLALQICKNFVGQRLQHQALVGEIMNAADPRILPGDDDIRRVLEDRRQDDHRLAAMPPSNRLLVPTPNWARPESTSSTALCPGTAS